MRRTRSSLHVAPERMRILIEQGRVEVDRLPDALAVTFEDPVRDETARSIRVAGPEWSLLPCEAYCPACGTRNPLAAPTPGC